MIFCVFRKVGGCWAGVVEVGCEVEGGGEEGEGDEVGEGDPGEMIWRLEERVKRVEVEVMRESFRKGRRGRKEREAERKRRVERGKKSDQPNSRSSLTDQISTIFFTSPCLLRICLQTALTNAMPVPPATITSVSTPARCGGTP